jgi:hypothetical protein
VGVAVFGSLYLTLDAGQPSLAPQASAHAIFVTLAWVAVTLACALAVALPLARVVRTAAQASPPS